MEQWRTLPGWEGLYEVSNEGCVRSLPRQVPHYTGKMLYRHGRLLHGCVTGRGYKKVTLCIDGKPKGEHVHSLVALAFIGPRPHGMLVRHLNGNPLDNTATNLAYGSAIENIEDMQAHGTMRRGETHPMSKLTADDIREMRTLRLKLTYQELADKFSVSVNQVDNIVNRRQWRHI